MSENAAAAPRRRGRRLDLALGVALGLIAGLAIVVAFVFLGDAGSIDSPHIEGVDTGKAQAPAAVERPGRE